MSRSTTRVVLGICIGLAVLAAAPVLAQNPTGTLKGNVTDESGGALPGVTVTATSPNLQGSRTTATGPNGDYKLAFLPPGLYRVTYELEGFATVVREVRVNAAQTATSDIRMKLSEVAEEIVVTGELTRISMSGTGEVTYSQDEIEKLAVSRDLTSSIALTPGVAFTGPSSAPSISGAMTFENLWLINGVVINENVRGSVLPLYIEDAIQETTTSVSGVSAEYGRFTGGVVNAITKSGGNQFSGSLRVNFINNDWESKTPLSGDRVDKTNDILEGTLGGYFWKDHLWFFAAGRDRELSDSSQTRAITNITFPTTDEEQRIEAKLTISPNPSHSLIGSYLEIDQVRTNTGFGTFLDLASLSDRQDPQEITSGNYTGILTPSFFVEAQYSERSFDIGQGQGGPRDLIQGTLMRRRGTGHRYFAPTFCARGVPGGCEPAFRNNENLLAKGSYFLSTADKGTHDIVFGYDTFDDIVFSVNHQTGSDFTVWSSDIIVDSQNNIFPVFSGSSTWIGWWAVFNSDLATPTSFSTNSFYVNDAWQLNDKWSFNVGVRYDENDGQNSAGSTVADDSKVSPRLGLSYDVRGDGDLVVNASYGTYVAGLLNSGNVADSTSTGGAIGLFLSSYLGPTVNTDPGCAATGTCTATADALRTLFDWYFANGGTDDLGGDLSNIPGLFLTDIPGVTSVVPTTFKSPAADEITIGMTKRLKDRGLFRADLVIRDWDDFYSNRIIPGNIVQTPAGPTDLEEVGNFGNDVLQREYVGIHTQFRYRVSDRLTVAGNYTWSETEGNINGETGVNGPIPSSPNSYREYRENRWAFPVGPLATDQEHRLNAWAVYDIIDNAHHNLNVSLLQRFLSGTPYSATGSVDTRPFVTNPGYIDPPTNVGIFFTPRGAFKTDDITSTDIGLNYSFRWNAFGRSMEVFIQPEVLNVFNEDGVIDVFTGTRDAVNNSSTACNGAPCQTFNPFTTTPVEGVHWAKREGFGEPENENDFQQPRTYRFSVGFRF